MRLSVDFWISVTEQSDELLLNEDAIDAFVQDAFLADPNLVNLGEFPETIEGATVENLILSISRPHSEELRFRKGGMVDKDDYDRYRLNSNLEQIPEMVNVQFGMVTERADMRTWPSPDFVYRSPETMDLDRFQENGLFPGDVVAVLQKSADGQWYFAQSYNYAAWVPRDKVAIGRRDEILAYADARPFLMVTGDRVITTCKSGSSSELTLEMGTRLPLISSDNQTDHVVRLPMRTEQGDLAFCSGLIDCDQDVHVGYLPYTRRNILQQAFKFLGERYGWGHSFNARDCTGLVLEVYKTFGFAFPRNSGQQGQSKIGQNLFFSPDASSQEKLQALERLQVGDLLYSPGHVMMYLGLFEGEHHVIHDVSGSGMTDKKGKYRDGVHKGVSVTPLIRIHSSPEETYFDRMYAIKRLR